MGRSGPRARVRVKICGITTPADALMAAQAGADAIGLNFHPPSPRAVSVETAARIRSVLPPFIAVVGVFVDPPEQIVRRALGAARLDYLQFHGVEPATFCQRFGAPYIKVAGMRAGFDFDAWQRAYPDASALLLDNYDRHGGGTGVPFDWSRWPCSDRPLILAGGLTPENVAAAIVATHPFAVDVASGVEGDTKGRKDAVRLHSFVEEATNA